MLNVSASVTVDGDLVDDNNTASAAIEATAANVTEPSNLTAKRADKTVTLTWDAPASSATSVTDDFESYEPWSLTFGDWTTIDADQGLAGSLTKSGSYTHQGEQFAFMDWQALAISSQPDRASILTPVRKLSLLFTRQMLLVRTSSVLTTG